MFIHLSNSIQNFYLLKGRARRAEYAYFQFFWWGLFCIYIIILSVISLLWISSMDADPNNLNLLDFLDGEQPANAFFSTILQRWAVFPLPFIFLLTIASITLEVRRWHDLGRSGLWSVMTRAVLVVPFIGSLILFLSWLYLILAEGEKGRNRYGDDPKQKKTYPRRRYYTKTALQRTATKKKSTDQVK